ncbi:amino acid permease (plasmid) [Bacillus toyonensis]|uniref:DUF1796 family putative cysteine peptidase n=1 Tax=Bacillus toyonensis TaxID=155322 RepID=UPI0006AA32DB|nr:DUF1796 family putative cysteine peptidase [Bacillus toyonensis]OKO50621.1 amino acid permease [Bacillus toyonensis]
MKLADIKRNYHVIFSLGADCYVGFWLNQFKLRPFSGFLDWVRSPSLKDVNQLLNNRFINFLELQYLTFVCYTPEGGHNLILRDNLYNIDFVHDFLATVNTPTSFPQYTEIKDKYNRRIQRFLNCTETSEWILFVRSGGTYEEAAELEKILSSMVKHNFQVLLILDGDIEEIKELDWELKHTCVVQFKMHPVRDYIHNKDACTMLFNGITLTS